MAKVGLWLRGARGKFAGAVLAKGAQGQTIQRELVKPSNPMTEGQATQRMKMAGLCNFYRGLSGILDHSFEGIKYGNDSRMYFMKLGLANPDAVAAINKNEKAFRALPLQISQGSLATALAVLPTDNYRCVIKGAETFGDWEGNRVDQINQLEVFAGVKGGQLTFVIVEKPLQHNNAQVVQIKRVILDGSADVVDDLQYITELFEDSGDGYLFYDEEVAGMAVIYSKEIDGKWCRSNEKLVLSSGYEQEIFNLDNVNRAKRGYMKPLSISDAQKYLNEGDSNDVAEIATLTMGGSVVPLNTTIQRTNGGMKFVIYGNENFDANKVSFVSTTGIAVGVPTITGRAYAIEVTLLAGATTTDQFVLKYGSVTVGTFKKSAS